MLSYPFGEDEKFGAICFGVVGGYTWLNYGLEPHDLIKDVDGVQEPVEDVTREQGFATYGVLVNVKGGYRYAYVTLGLAIYYQDYGQFELLNEVDVELRGLTFVPTLGLEVRY